MYFTFLKTLSDAQVLILFPAIACGALLLLTYSFRRFRKLFGLNEYDQDVVDTATQNTMSGAYVVLGFVLVLAMTTVSDLDSNVSQEATAIKSVERLLVLEGSTSAIAARQQLITYTQSILQDEWPELKHGHGSTVTSAALKDFFMSLDKINPRSPKDTVLYAKILDAAGKSAELRNSRIYSIQSNLPGTFYLVSLVSLLGVTIICALRLLEATPMRCISLFVQIIMLTLMFSAIVIIDLPYLGDTVTSPGAIELAIESMVKRTLPFY